jgi:anti-sigma factor (TIGR02949 family)
MEPSDKSPKKNNCENEQSCIEMLQSIIDGEASPEQRYEFLTNHVEKCMPCFKTYHLEMAIKDLVKAKCSGQCPDGLVDEIKAKIATLR